MINVSNEKEENVKIYKENKKRVDLQLITSLFRKVSCSPNGQKTTKKECWNKIT